ncbi:Kelch repeat-containing protein [Handroanthus impetiginosus]|uniref:Kelch repeat-containing protein n=1 Tax=Handroanthus impetiginosus TaxID=429701 RepID=A0A2G9I258_9LAMI|nr:Kelch repeat-containing protein [Handroanthus impetiginosus]
MIWTEPVINGTPPIPRDSHSCTTVGDNLFVFGGTDGRRPLDDLHILDTSSNTWILPSVRGNAPEPREGHSAALIGKRLFIFGGCGKSENSEVYYDDLYILNTETFSWKRLIPSGTPPSKRDSHTCSSWKNKIIVIGGEDSSDYYLSDVHILDTDTLVWCKLNTTGQILPPRGGHTTVGIGKNLFVFGGFSDEQNLYDDVYMLDVENGTWAKIIAIGDGPSGRFSMAGESLDPQMRGVLVFIGGCNKNLEALDDMYFLHTGLSTVTNRDERRIEKLSLRKQLKLKCQEQRSVTPAYDKVTYGVQHGHDPTIYQPMPISSYMPSGRQNFYLNEYQTPFGKRTFQAKVTKSFPDGYTIETIIDGKPLRGVLFSNKQPSISTGADNSNRKTDAKTNGNNGANVRGDHNFGVESEEPAKHDTNDVKQEDAVQKEKEVAEAQAEVAEVAEAQAEVAEVAEAQAEVAEANVEVAAPDPKDPAAAESSMPQEVLGVSEQPTEPNINAGSDVTNNPSSSDAEIQKENVSAVVKDQNTPLH